MNEGTLVPWLGFSGLSRTRNLVDCQGRACGPAPLADVLGGSVTYGVPSATRPPPVVSKAKHVDRGGFLPDPGQLTSPVGMDDDGAPGEPPGRPTSHPAPASPPVPAEPPGRRRATLGRRGHFIGEPAKWSVLPVKSQGENGPLQGRTSQVAGALQAGCPRTARTCVRRAEISRGERTTSGENLSSGRRLAGWMSANRPHLCQESR